MKVNTDLSGILKQEHEEKWVALSEDRTSVIDYAETLADLSKRLGERDDVVYMKVLAHNAEFAC